MLPVSASVNTFNFQTPLVNTALPGTAALHVPSDNVAPSVSGAQVDNNTNANTTITSTAGQEEQAASTVTDSTQGDGSGFSSLVQTGSNNSNSSVQAAFVAQLAAQDGSPATQVILVQYEKLVAYSNVKYKPSNAQKPPEPPSGVFGRILQSEKATAAQHTAALPQDKAGTNSQEQTQQTQPGQEQAVLPVANTADNGTGTINDNGNDNGATLSTETVILPPQQSQPIPRSNKTASGTTTGTTDIAGDTIGFSPGSITSAGGNDTGDTIGTGAGAIPPHVIDAYAATASRIGSFNNSAVQLA